MIQRLLFTLIAILLLLPIVAYTYKFGIGLWSSPSQWSDLGGYIGGVYTPILALLTLLVLCVQIYLQALQHKQHIISLQESELSDYLNHLNVELDQIVTEGLTLRQLLLHTLNNKNLEDIESMDLDIIFDINQDHHKLYSMWAGVRTCLKSIENHSKIKNFESIHHTIQKNKVIAYLSPQVCSSLDKFNYSIHLGLEQMTGAPINENATHYDFWQNKALP